MQLNLCKRSPLVRSTLILFTALLTGTGSLNAQRPERFNYKGVTYQIVDVIDVKGSSATLRTSDSKLITVPIRFLSSRLRAKAEHAAKKKKSTGGAALSIVTDNASATELALQQSITQGTPLKRWVNGTVSNDQIDGGLLVVSSVTALAIKLDRDGVPLPPKKVKGKAIFINGLVMVEGAGKKSFNQHVEYTAWDTGERIEHKGQQIPKLTLKKVPPRLLVEERTWTNTDGNSLVAALVSVIEDMGNFQRADGSEFKYSIEKLSKSDQKEIRDTIKDRYQELRSTL